MESITAADGTPLAVRRTGTGAPVVLVHGSAGGLESWDPVLPFLDGLELWTFTRRGYPGSGPARDKTFADDVADLAAVLAEVGTPAHLVGGSYGGAVVLHAARDGADLRSLTVWEAPLYSAGPALRPALDRYRGLLDDGDLATAGRLFAERVARVPAAMLDALGDGVAMQCAEAAGCLSDLEAMVADDPDLGRFAGIAVPTLLVQGSDTWSPMPETMDALAAVLPHASRATLAGQDHFATHTAPELWAATLRRFLQER
jgi:pimeloyl-ACP methyl ester carboxylesterase